MCSIFFYRPRLAYVLTALDLWFKILTEIVYVSTFSTFVSILFSSYVSTLLEQNWLFFDCLDCYFDFLNLFFWHSLPMFWLIGPKQGMSRFCFECVSTSSAYVLTSSTAVLTFSTYVLTFWAKTWYVSAFVLDLCFDFSTKIGYVSTLSTYVSTSSTSVLTFLTYDLTFWIKIGYISILCSTYVSTFSTKIG